MPPPTDASEPATRPDVIVVGGGHAGVEAAAAAARAGARCTLITQSADAIGRMSCNPAIGGIGKSHLVREVDALGGLMAIAADRAAIQVRVLNERKGAAVRATRAQTDRKLYATAIQQAVVAQRGISIVEDEVADLIVADGEARGVVTAQGARLGAGAVVLATGTFLGGRLFTGLDSTPGGRVGDPPSNALAERLRATSLRVARLKTGTPPRIDGRTVDFDRLTEQPGLNPPPALSLLGRAEPPARQVSCHIGFTNERTHAIIRDNLDRSPIYRGAIEGPGPRYCPSIEDKIVRFTDRAEHQVFVEPEGLDTDELYPNGISTSLPLDVQVALVRTIDGFEKAELTRAGYAVEYDYLDPRDLTHGLESKVIPRLFLAGQINGTTGYEEAAAQGLLAGVNAARRAAGEAPFRPRRDRSYLGVMVDDLVTSGLTEPYRMFTSRAEHRLFLREDNADLRLTEIGRELGLIDDHRWERFAARRDRVHDAITSLTSFVVRPGSETAGLIQRWTGKPLTAEETLMELLRRPEVDFAGVAQLAGLSVDPDTVTQVEIEATYGAYIERQRREAREARRHEHVELPASLDYDAVRGLSNEVRERLKGAHPPTLGAAARLPGVTPAAVSLLLVHIKRIARRAREELRTSG